MYQSQSPQPPPHSQFSPLSPAPSSSSSYGSPSDPYRQSPINIPPRQAYNSTLSPPPISSNGLPQPPSIIGNMGYQQQGSSRYPQQNLPANGYASQQYASRSGGARYSQPSPNYSSGSQARSPNLHAHAQGAGGILPQQTPQQKYKGTLPPGSHVKVGDQQVKIERYLSEGGYAHVYLTTSEYPIYPPKSGEDDGNSSKKGRWGEKGYTTHCLKRIAFEDEKVWADVRKEIAVMKALPSNPHLTQYLASAHSRLPNGGYEVFILMEFCSGGGIIDLLNKRLRDRLKEIEILNIFTDVCEAVAAMHFLKQPLLHRDLKIENVLSAPTGQPPTPQRPTPLTFKLCDFGSTTFPSTHPPQNKIEAESLAMDLNKHTTLQYRSPEMVEPMLGWPVGLPSDVWALGVLLYKLCYYTTPFEEHGTLAIVNAKYTFPQYPVYSPRIQHLIASMLVDHPARRPSVFEVLRMTHEMSGTRPEIDYPISNRSFALSPQNTQQSQPRQNSGNLLDFTSPTPPPASQMAFQQDLASSIAPQRRGRPTRDPSSKSITSMSGIPPMPQPPSVSKIASSPPSQPPATAPSQSSVAKAPALQVTGEIATETEKPQGQPKGGEKKTSLDAFGMPTKAAPASSSQGFGDSFSSPAYKPYGPAATGFKDSFAARLAASGSKPPSPVPSSPSASMPGSTPAKISTTAPPTVSQKPPTQSTAKPTPTPRTDDGDVSFETRFPSLEALDVDIPQPPAPVINSPENLISPIITSPDAPLLSNPPAKASMMGHLTGDRSQQHQSLGPPKADGAPQPRSTQVTGTAFKGIQGGMLSPANQKQDYFGGGRAGGSQKKQQQEDLMTGGRMNSLDVAPPAVGTKKGEKVEAKDDKVIDSSDEEPAPESATASGRRPISPEDIKSEANNGNASLANRKAIFESGKNGSSSPLSAKREPSPIKQSSAPAPLTAKPTFQRQVSTEKSRPQSMFMPSSSTSKPLISPVGGTPPSYTPSVAGQRPSHTRKGSVNEMLSKFEEMQSPSSSSNIGLLQRQPSPIKDSLQRPENVESKDQVGIAKKPSIAVKPQALRKPSMDMRSAENPEQQAISPPSTNKVPDLIKPKPKIADKPTIARKPSKHAEMPGVAGYSKSSSGRSFPISKPASVALPSANDGKSVDENPTEAAQAGSRKGSPDKQQSVGSLIARWNKGP